MINLFSIRCSLAFAPYLERALAEYLESGYSRPLVVRQGGNGLEARVDSPESRPPSLIVRHEGREDGLDADSARHYRATIEFRTALFDVRRTSDEVVLAKTADGVLISFPLSQIFLEPEAAGAVVSCFKAGCVAATDALAVPDWLVISASADRLLLSDQRSGRWVLLAEEHIDYLEDSCRDSNFADARGAIRTRCPGITVKGIEVPLFSAFRVARALEEFVASGKVTALNDVTPDGSIAIANAPEGIELRDTSHRVSLNAREAAKWGSIIRAEIERLKAMEFERGCIRTVVANADEGRRVIQGGDQILAGRGFIDECRKIASAVPDSSRMHCGDLVHQQSNDRMLLLSKTSGHCVALTEAEVDALFE